MADHRTWPNLVDLSPPVLGGVFRFRIHPLCWQTSGRYAVDPVIHWHYWSSIERQGCPFLLLRSALTKPTGAYCERCELHPLEINSFLIALIFPRVFTSSIVSIPSPLPQP